MKTIDPENIADLLNSYYRDIVFDPVNAMKDPATVQMFIDHVESISGLKLTVTSRNPEGAFGYRIELVEVVDQGKFTLWALKNL